jgi:hypothetical protein
MESVECYKNRKKDLCCTIITDKNSLESLKIDMRESIEMNLKTDDIMHDIFKDLEEFGLDFEEEEVEDLEAEANSNYMKDAI